MFTIFQVKIPLQLEYLHVYPRVKELNSSFMPSPRHYHGAANELDIAMSFGGNLYS